MIAVTFALPAESKSFRALVRNTQRQDRDNLTTIEGIIGEAHVEIFHTGVGRKSAQDKIEKFLRNAPPHALISAGFAGAVTDKIAIGDLFLAENFSSPPLLAKAKELLADSFTRVGKLATVDLVVDSLSDRNKIAAETGALAVDMETEFIAAAAAARNIPLLSVRVITDTPSSPLPAPPQILFDLARQKTDFLKLGPYLAKNPARLFRLLSFARRIGRCRESLAGALDILVRVI